ncbi:phage tail tip lysozyme [Staphylococcus simulans]|uniref:phage tail tip lysozyme n=1 Tax=Staphylococcus simulans TaxID=1286 RepID=UPI000D1ECC95|nr:phage tail tip lysozyme [Staphylococcus simulans]PTJ36438.1 hypothetical protein BU024_10265 [Staphylococcus simulans]
MSKRRKNVEIEADLKGTESQSSTNKVTDPSETASTTSSSNLSDYNNKYDDQSNTKDGSNNNEKIDNRDIVSDANTSEKPSTNDNKQVFEDSKKDKVPENNQNSNKVESNGGHLSNTTAGQQGEQSIPDQPDETSENNVNDNNQAQYNKDNQSGSDNSQNHNETHNKVTDSNNMESAENNGIKQEIADKMGAYSDTVNKLNKVRDFKNLKNMSKEQATKEVVDIGKDIAKKKVLALLTTYVAPYIIPILLGILAIIVVIFVILAAITGSDGGDNKTKKQGCTNVNENSSNIKVSKDGEKNAEKIYDYLIKNVDGSTPKSVSAHLGNMAVETGHTFDPKIVQGNNEYKEEIAKDESVGGYALGIAQWDSGRRVNLIKYAEKQNKSWDDFGVQLDFMLNHDGADSGTIKDILKSDGSINSTTERIMREWERAGDTSSLSERQNAASKFYSKFSKKDGSSSDDNIDDATEAASDNSDASENSGCNDTDSTGGSGEIGESVEANGKSGEMKQQWASKDEMPEKYKKAIKIPDFKKSVLDSPENIFPSTGNKGQCTELTWGYMKQMYGSQQPTNGNGNVIYKAYEAQGAKVTANPTVGYGFSSDPPLAGAADASVGHTGIVAGVMDNGDWIMANYNLNGEGNNGQRRVLTYALIDGNKKSGGIKFFSGIGKSKVKSKD